MNLKRNLLALSLSAISMIVLAWPQARHVSAFQGLVPVHDIQGSGSASPVAGQQVTTEGIVTAVVTDGFFLQAPEAEADSDPNTSEGIFVSSSIQDAVIVGNRLRVTGIVKETRSDSEPGGPARTELANVGSTEVVGVANPIPEPAQITLFDLNPFGPFEQLEKLEGMRVRVALLFTIAPTGGSVDGRTATASSDGVFWGTLRPLRPFREPGISVLDALPPGTPPGVPRFDENPERLRIDTTRRAGGQPVNVSTGVQIPDLRGVLDFSERAYTILPEPGLAAGAGQASAVRDPSAEFTVSSFRLQRFFDTTDDPDLSDVALTQQAFNNQLSKASLAIRNLMRSPDIIAVDGVENLATLQALAARLNTDSVAGGQPDPIYLALLLDGNDQSGLDLGFLVKNSKVSLFRVDQIGKDATFTDPVTSASTALHDRPPLVLRAAPISEDGPSLPITVVAAHVQSSEGIDDAVEGPRVRARRRAQAEFLANLLQGEQADSSNRIICLGDFNSFQFNDGYVDVMGTISGNPTPPDQVLLASEDLVNPNFFNLIGPVSPDQRYSSVSEGNSQALDHILVSQSMLPRTAGFAFARCNADFPETLRNNPERPERISDRDMPVAYFRFQDGFADLEVRISASPNPVPQNTFVTFTIDITNHGPDTANGVTVRDSFLPPGLVIPSLGAGGLASIRFPRLVTEPVGSVVVNTVTVSSNQLDPNDLNNSSTVNVSVVAAAPKIDFAQLEGKKLTVFGQGFEPRSKIEVNGRVQKTRPGDQLVLQSLIAKKGGKKIDPGETVTITVVNPDGTRSAPFQLTRPG
jgi:uncharacterized repeat protein (TIGR01451 family)